MDLSSEPRPCRLCGVVRPPSELWGYTFYLQLEGHMAPPKKTPRKSGSVKIKDLKRKSVSMRATGRIKGGKAKWPGGTI